MPIPESTMPRRSVATGSWISSPSVGASSSPAHANVIVANRLSNGRSSRLGSSAGAVSGVALPCATRDHAASATKIAAGSQVPYAPRFCTHFPTRSPMRFSPRAIHRLVREKAAMNHLFSARWTKPGPPT